ncbi:hypothetical protein [Ruminococcus sp.]|uniref:hypothetical protein n=1 Tax=Ruminococcus sp. TaxID=41978 RepID=UPI0025F63296|nr:hypothetical protein [Ruminococcus sp.]
MKWDKSPAIVQYTGNSNKQFTKGKQYEAFFVEYRQGVRNILHVRDNSGEISDFTTVEDFEVIIDEDNVLNLNEATVRCITHKYDGSMLELKYGREYKAIGCDKDGFFLVMDESYDCYFYPPEFFEVIQDEKGILTQRSIYCNYKGRDVN